MPRRRKSPESRFNEGCGQGTGQDYQPTIWISDFPSKGLSTQSNGWKTGRIHHCLSQLELRYFYILEWSPIIVDIREQFPLNREETEQIADDNGYDHPTNPHTQNPNLMTTDFLITVTGQMGVIHHARSIKPARELDNIRTLEKLDIERFYWESRQTSWKIVTEHQIPDTLTANIQWLHNYYYPQDLKPLKQRDIRQITTVLTQGILTQNASLRDIAADCDDRLSLGIGDSLMVARHLIATRQWRIDLNYPLQTQFRNQLHFLTPPSLKSEIGRDVG